MRDVEHLNLRANGQTFYCAAAGPADGPPVFLLHGFPEISYGWRHQLWPLAHAGFRVYAPDQRGYGLSSKPTRRQDYVLAELTADVLALAEGLGHARFAVVGHDWGGIVAWRLAELRPDRLTRVAILNAPNVSVFGGFVAAHPTQLLRSAYVAALQIPIASSAALRANDFWLLRSMLARTSRQGTFSDAELDVYAKAWAMPGALEAMLKWYRALPLNEARAQHRISIPTLILWGDADVALEPGLAEASALRCDNAEVQHLSGVGHWIQHEAAADVNARLICFLDASSSAADTKAMS
jgi:pimeloyl-ACP methyl ester carboxylesterase